MIRTVRRQHEQFVAAAISEGECGDDQRDFGGRLVVRETFLYRNNKTAVLHKASMSEIDAAGVGALYGGWKPSIHMPRWACRTVLEIIEIRVQRVQEISEEDARAEGATIKSDAEIAARVAGDTPARMEFWALWKSIHGADSWVVNPWVWCITFKRVQS